MTTTDTEAAALRQQIRELRADNAAMRAQLDGDLPKATAWLQAKVWRQAAALDLLNRRVLQQRLALRTIEQLGRGLTSDEYRAARADLAEPVRERTPEAVPA